jgi:hypothetical protein|tara:strand:- start:404 stop:601 length:198 start_codon:yes stop_codon:yes gene_type:complete
MGKKMSSWKREMLIQPKEDIEIENKPSSQKTLIDYDNSQSKLKEEIQLNTRANPHDAIKSYEDLF